MVVVATVVGAAVLAVVELLDSTNPFDSGEATIDEHEAAKRPTPANAGRRLPIR